MDTIKILLRLMVCIGNLSPNATHRRDTRVQSPDRTTAPQRQVERADGLKGDVVERLATGIHSLNLGERDLTSTPAMAIQDHGTSLNPRPDTVNLQNPARRPLTVSHTAPPADFSSERPTTEPANILYPLVERPQLVHKSKSAPDPGSAKCRPSVVPAAPGFTRPAQSSGESISPDKKEGTWGKKVNTLASPTPNQKAPIAKAKTPTRPSSKSPPALAIPQHPQKSPPGTEAVAHRPTVSPPRNKQPRAVSSSSSKVQCLAKTRTGKRCQNTVNSAATLQVIALEQSLSSEDFSAALGVEMVSELEVHQLCGTHRRQSLERETMMETRTGFLPYSGEPFMTGKFTNLLNMSAIHRMD